MIGARRLVSLSTAALALIAPAALSRASAQATQTTADATIIYPVTVTKLDDMDFG